MPSEDRNQEILNQMVSPNDYYRPLAIAGAAVLGAGLFYYLNNSSKKSAHLFDHKNQTRELENGVRINSLLKTDKLKSYYYEDGKTLYELFVKAVKTSNDGAYLGWKPTSKEPYQWLTYSQVATEAQNLGSAFVHFGLKPAAENYVGIFARNRPEWVMTDTACQMFNFVNVPLYDTLGLEAISFILLQTQLKVVICDDSSKALHLMNSKSSVEYIIVVEKVTAEANEKATQMDIKIMSFEEAKSIGKLNLKAPVPPKPEDLATICYTSGTTGLPKGALITHENVVSISASLLVYLKDTGLVGNTSEQERFISYLPLAHMFERVSQATVVSLGGAIGFYQGDIKKLADDMKEIKPTIFCTVPRLINRIYSKITDNLEHAPEYKKMIFKFAFAQKEKEVKRGIIRNNGICDLVFKQVRESLGGCVKFIITGSAPISPDILHFLRVVSGCHVTEGYGATETGGACSIQLPGESTVGNVGPPFLCSKLKLIDVPEMNLTVEKDKRGEILIAGPNVFKGYFKDEEKTKAALDADGWYHSGDIGTFDENGCLKIVDRVKNIFKLQQGEYIAPEKIENIFVRSKYVAQVFVYGNSYKSSLVSIVVPEESVAFEWARKHNCELNMESLCKNDDFKKTILNDMNKIGKESRLNTFELTRVVHLHPELFTIENGLLTPTMKSKRKDIQKFFQKELDEMYKDLD